MTEQKDWREKQLSQVAYGSEYLKCLRAGDTVCRHKAKDIDRLKRREAERRSGRRSSASLKGRKMAVVNQTNIGTNSKATLGKLPGDVLERIIM